MAALMLGGAAACGAEAQNVAPQAVAAASSQNSAAGQTADKAVDGVVDGWPRDFTKEWVTDGGQAGSWLELKWSTPQALERVVLFDRRNGQDAITGGQLSFDDGGTIDVGALPEDGGALTVAFTKRRTSTLRFTVTGVSAGTRDVGLAELQAWTGGAVAASPSEPTAPSTPACGAGSVVNVIAHPDDDLLFLSPGLSDSLRAGRCVQTVVVTAGDGGYGAAYAARRRAGLQAAYSDLAGAPNSWLTVGMTLADQPAVFTRLASRPEVSLIFLDLPDGNLAGQGFPSTGGVSLRKLWDGDLSSIRAPGTSASYTRARLTTAMTQILDQAAPTEINTLDPRTSSADHSDHHYVARLVDAAARSRTGSPEVRFYVGYRVSDQEPNVSGADLTTKKQAFYAYAAFDDKVCSSDQTCTGSPYGTWLQRQYRVPR